jgi:hypothetical protein
MANMDNLWASERGQRVAKWLWPEGVEWSAGDGDLKRLRDGLVEILQPGHRMKTYRDWRHSHWVSDYEATAIQTYAAIERLGIDGWYFDNDNDGRWVAHRHADRHRPFWTLASVPTLADCVIAAAEACMKEEKEHEAKR